MRISIVALCLVAVAGCASLPHDGPSRRSVSREVRKGVALYGLIDLNYAATETIAAHPPLALAGLAGTSSSAPNDRIAEGDVLAVSIFEAGAGGLFSRIPTADMSGQSSGSGSTQPSLPRLVVDEGGDVQIPFAGAPVHIAGLTPQSAAEAIRLALRDRAVDPQVSLSVTESRANSVAVIGQVRNPGHYLLSSHNDRLIDVLTSAGGPVKPPADLAAVVYRGIDHAEAQLSDVMNDPAQNIRLAPGDQIRIVDRPRKFSTFGALLRDYQGLIEDDNLTLADAISRSGGLDTNSAANQSVLVFRFEQPSVAAALGVTKQPTDRGVPIVYRLDLSRPESLFVAGNFDMRSGDILYVPRSDLTELGKFFTLVNSVTQIGYNVRATSTIP